MKKSTLLIFFLTITRLLYSQEVTLYEKDGAAVCYISSENQTIYTWAGTPLGYLITENGDTHFYTFSGKHLGWYDNGIIRDHKGDVFWFTKNSISNIVYKLEGLKGLKKMAPLKEYKELAPIKPIYTLNFSPYANLLSYEPADNSSAVFAQKSNLQPVNPSIANTDAIVNSYKAALENYSKQKVQEQENARQMTELGLVYDYESKSWAKPEIKKSWDEQRIKEKETLSVRIQQAYQNWEKLKNSLPKLASGTYKATLINDHTCLDVYVILKKDIFGSLKIKHINLSKGFTYKLKSEIKDRKCKIELLYVTIYNSRYEQIDSQYAEILFDGY